MFDNERYMTRGINEEVPLVLQIYLWNLIDEARKKVELDYLQVFKMYVEDGVLKIVHSQEIPNYKMEYTLNVDETVEGKIYVTDSGTYSTMMFNYEY